MRVKEEKEKEEEHFHFPDNFNCCKKSKSKIVCGWLQGTPKKDDCGDDDNGDNVHTTITVESGEGVQPLNKTSATKKLWTKDALVLPFFPINNSKWKCQLGK